MEKESGFIMTALGGHALQNIAGAKLVKSKSFITDTAKHLTAGALGRNGRKGTLKEGLKTAVTSVGVPEAVMAHNRAYAAGQGLHNKAKALGVNLENLGRRDVAKIRMAAEGRLPEKHRTSLTDRARDLVKGNHLPKKTLRAGHIKEILNRPAGNLKPHSTKAIVAGNAVASIAEPGIGALNAAKFATEHKGFQNTRVGKYIEHNFVHKPLTDAFKSGAAGHAVNKAKELGYKYGVNGAVGEAISQAHKAGAKAVGRMK